MGKSKPGPKPKKAAGRSQKGLTARKNGTKHRLRWTEQMTSIFYEEAAERQHLINRSSNKQAKFATDKQRWQPLLNIVNFRFELEVPSKPRIEFKQLMAKISNTKKAAKTAWNHSRYAHKTGDPTSLEDMQDFFDHEQATAVLPTFLEFLYHFWDVPEWTVIHHAAADDTLEDDNSREEEGRSDSSSSGTGSGEGTSEHNSSDTSDAEDDQGQQFKAVAGPKHARIRVRSSAGQAAGFEALPQHLAEESVLERVAAWRLALLRIHHSRLENFSLAWQLKGVSFDNRQALVRQLQPGQGVIFCKEPSNPADPHAVAVLTSGMQHLGYLPRAVAKHWKLQRCFGQVLSSGPAHGTDLWGASTLCKALVHGLCLDLLPDSWKDMADLQQVLGPNQWLLLQQAVLEQYGHRCAVSSMPAVKLQQPLRVMPQWRVDAYTKQVQLAGLIPLCEPVCGVLVQLAHAADQLAQSSAVLQLRTAIEETETDLGPLQIAVQAVQALEEAVSNSSDVNDQQALREDLQHRVTAFAAVQANSQAQHALQAVAALPHEQQEAFRWFGILTSWQPLDCVRHVAQAGLRRQQLEQDGWQLVVPAAQDIQALVPYATAGRTRAPVSI